MRRILERHNRVMLQTVGALLDALRHAKEQTPPELEAYRAQLLQLCAELQARVHRNLAHLSLGQDDLLEDVLSNTGVVTRLVRLVSSRLASPVLRARASDRLCLTTIGWLHATHPRTVGCAPAFVDGGCGIWPFLDLAAVYFFPCIEQRGLLYQPLLFHEFGHLLYARHKPELDALVGDLQREVHEWLLPVSQRNDRHAQHQAAQRQAIADTWYRWAQELFADAVGFTIGGPCFLLAFSSFLSNMQRGDYCRHPAELGRSDHPITWLRVQFLTARARAVGFGQLAERVDAEWRGVADSMGVDEDYHGFYDHELTDIVVRALDDMLTEAGPRGCTDDEAAGNAWVPGKDSPARLFNWAWQTHEAAPDRYAAWESGRVAVLLAHGSS